MVLLFVFFFCVIAIFVFFFTSNILFRLPLICLPIPKSFNTSTESIMNNQPIPNGIVFCILQRFLLIFLKNKKKKKLRHFIELNRLAKSKSEKLDFRWENISYWVKVKKEYKPILKNVSGELCQ